MGVTQFNGIGHQYASTPQHSRQPADGIDHVQLGWKPWSSTDSALDAVP